MSGTTASRETVVRRSDRGWVVGDEEASDLTSAMVLADLLAADLASGGAAPAGAAPAGAAPAGPPKAAPTPARPLGEADEAARLAVTVARLEHAPTARGRVEPALGERA